MAFKFKIQPYQTVAVNSVVCALAGQPYNAHVGYIRDLGTYAKENAKRAAVQSSLFNAEEGMQSSLFQDDDEAELYNENGFRNAELMLTRAQLLENLRHVQGENNIPLSSKIKHELSQLDIDVSMETGTGKTYVYIKTMFELNKQYGFSKFIVVVPSIAIREGVYSSFDNTAEHFMEHYGKKARFFIYNSANLNQLDYFSSSADIHVMIINTQAFAASLKEGAKNKESRIIYSKRDSFASRRPIDVIKSNRPIMILDEPQKMSGDVTQKAIRNFNPLFTISYSATHKKEDNFIYQLDPLDAFNERLVKKIEVKGFEVKNFRGTDKYLYLERIILAKDKSPRAKIELEIAYNKSINRETRILQEGDNLYYTSQEMEQYKGYVIAEIDALQGSVTFTNGEVIYAGDVVGDISERDMRRIQIRETILSHFQKEEALYHRGIKTLSLFFIDEVAKYRQYDADGNELLGEYGEMFEEEYLAVLNEYQTMARTPYQDYLRKHCGDVATVHRGYFSIDKKTGRSTDSALKRGAEFSDDVSAYDLILRNKERLLSFAEPTRFIFSHSALREGWDNPNIFQICTLKHSDSTMVRRQEVGRGLRLCVDQTLNRMDAISCGESVHDINVLTVIASESYKEFVSALQADTKAQLYARPLKASESYFIGKKINVDDTFVVIDKAQAKAIYKYLIKNDYIEDDDSIAPKYRQSLENHTLAPLPEALAPMTDGVQQLIQSVFDKTAVDNMYGDANKTKIDGNPLNDNFYKKEFQELWKRINHQYAYTVQFDSDELIHKAIVNINEKLFVSALQYTATVGAQKKEMNEHDLARGESFHTAKTRTQQLVHAQSSRIKYDLIGKICVGTTLLRRTVVAILQGIAPAKFALFQNNPEEFISKVIKLINEQKAGVVVEHIGYNQTSGVYEQDIFTATKPSEQADRAFAAKRHIQDYVFTDGLAKDSIERKFAQELDVAAEVCAYAKLPKGFHIPTPVGNYSPDWAIAFNEGMVKHIFFIAETKGTMESLQLRPIEQAKISCARKLFNQISTEHVKYHDVDSYQHLLEVMSTL